LAKYWNDTGPSIVIPPKPVPTIEELLASPESPYIWLDPEFEAPLERAIAKVEKNTSIVRGSQDWRSAIGDQYRHYLRKYYVEERPVIPFVPATDEQLREWESDAMWRFREEEELCDLYRLMTTPEALQEHWRKANEQAAKSHCYRKSDRETFRISDFKELVRRGLVELKDWMWREDPSSYTTAAQNRNRLAKGMVCRGRRRCTG
jgi:hypothetical protein